MTDKQDRCSSSMRLRQAIRTVRAKVTLVSCAAVIAILTTAVPHELGIATRLLIGWNAGICLYLALTWRMMLRSDVHQLRRRAALEDEAEWLILMLTAIAALASLAAIAVELHGVRVANSTSQGWRIVLAASTILVSWFFLHTILALHYAHDYTTITRPRRSAAASGFRTTSRSLATGTSSTLPLR
jgi:uncharacterized membrane protein